MTFPTFLQYLAEYGDHQINSKPTTLLFNLARYVCAHHQPDIFLFFLTVAHIWDLSCSRFRYCWRYVISNYITRMTRQDIGIEQNLNYLLNSRKLPWGDRIKQPTARLNLGEQYCRSLMLWSYLPVLTNWITLLPL